MASLRRLPLRLFSLVAVAVLSSVAVPILFLVTNFNLASAVLVNKAKQGPKPISITIITTRGQLRGKFESNADSEESKFKLNLPRLVPLSACVKLVVQTAIIDIVNVESEAAILVPEGVSESGSGYL